MDVVNRILTGFPLVGTMPEVSVFEQRPAHQAVIGADPVWLARTAEAARTDLKNQVANTISDDVLRSIYKTTTDK